MHGVAVTNMRTEPKRQGLFVWGNENEYYYDSDSGTDSSATPLMLTPYRLTYAHILHISCAGSIIGMIIKPLPSWWELKPIIVGWLKDNLCSFHHSRGVPLAILQFIIELVWNCDLPAPLVVHPHTPNILLK